MTIKENYIMAKRFKDFGSGKDLSKIEPLSFMLHGEEFLCTPVVQVKFLLEIISTTANTEDDPTASSRMFNDFFSHVLFEESYTRFESLLEDKNRLVEVETLSEIVAWLMEEYTSRPNQPAEV
jgi:hypothetical protein